MTLIPKFHLYKMKIYTDEIAIRANAHTNRKCINGNSMRWLVRLK